MNKDALIDMRECASARDQTGDKLLAIHIGAWADELEYLRQRLADEERLARHHSGMAEAYGIENDELRAKLALAEQLLRECVANREGLAYEAELLARIDAAIDASGENHGL